MDVTALLSRLAELVRGKTRRLRPYEEAIFAAIQERLGPHERDVLSRQIAVRPLIQRSIGNRMVLFAFDGQRHDQIPLFDNRDDAHCLARAHLRSGSSRNVVLLMIHGGRLSSLEFRRTLRHLQAAPLEVRDITLHVTETSVASALDRLEHGRSDDER